MRVKHSVTATNAICVIGSESDTICNDSQADIANEQLRIKLAKFSVKGGVSCEARRSQGR